MSIFGERSYLYAYGVNSHCHRHKSRHANNHPVRWQHARPIRSNLLRIRIVRRSDKTAKNSEKTNKRGTDRTNENTQKHAYIHHVVC